MTRTQVTVPTHTDDFTWRYVKNLSRTLFLAPRQNRGFGDIQLPRPQFSKSSSDVFPRVTSQMPDDDGDDARFHDNVRQASPRVESRDPRRRMNLPPVSKPRYADHVGPNPRLLRHPSDHPYISPAQSHWGLPHSMHPLDFTPSITLSACDLLHSLSVAARRVHDPICAQNILNAVHPNHPTYLYPYPYPLPTTTPRHLPVRMVIERRSPGNFCHVTRSSDNPRASSGSNTVDTGSGKSSWRRCDDVTEDERKLLASNRMRKPSSAFWRPY